MIKVGDWVTLKNDIDDCKKGDSGIITSIIGEVYAINIKKNKNCNNKNDAIFANKDEVIQGSSCN